MVYTPFLIIILIIVVCKYILFTNVIDMNKKNKEILSEKEIIDESSETRTRLIVTYKGDRYDISDFIRKHPGGMKVLLDNNGNDIEKLMEQTEHSEKAFQLLYRYKIN